MGERLRDPQMLEPGERVKWITNRNYRGTIRFLVEYKQGQKSDYYAVYLDPVEGTRRSLRKTIVSRHLARLTELELLADVAERNDDENFLPYGRSRSG